MPDEIVEQLKPGEMSPEMKRYLEKKYEKDFERSNKDGSARISNEEVIVARDQLGLHKKKWSVATLRAVETFGDFLRDPTNVRRIAAVNVLHVEELVEYAMDSAQEIADDDTQSAEDRTRALSVVVAAGKVCGDLSAQMLEIAESKNGSDGKRKPANKPPSLAMETQSPDGTVTRVVASNGESGNPE